MGGTMIPTRPIGRTGIEISRIGFGGAPIGDLKRSPSDADTRDLLQAAWDAGIRYFDTAPMYGNGLSERRIGDFLRDKPRDEYVLSSKVGRMLVPDRAGATKEYGTPRAMPFRHAFDFTYDAVMRCHEQSLQRLGLERIDILLLHDLGRFAQGDNYDRSLRQALESGIKALQELRATGQIRAVGAGVNEWHVLDLLMDHAQFDVFLLANRYTLLDQQVLDAFLPRCAKEGVSIIDGAPLNGGILATGATPDARYDYRPATKEMIEKVNGIEAVCRSFGLPLVRAGLNFPLGHDSVVAIIPGFATPEDFRQNLRHFQAEVPVELWATLKQKGLLHPDAPVPVTPILGS